MAKEKFKKYAKPFGKKEKVLNYASNTYQLTRPNKVGEVMALIRECQPKAFERRENFYFENAYSKSKDSYIEFEESDPELDRAGDIDYIGKVGEKAFGIQIKPITANANFGNYNISERMSASFQDFEEKYGGKVFVIFSARTGNKKDIVNIEIIKEIETEIERLRS